MVLHLEYGGAPCLLLDCTAKVLGPVSTPFGVVGNDDGCAHVALGFESGGGVGLIVEVDRGVAGSELVEGAECCVALWAVWERVDGDGVHVILLG